MHGLMAGRLVPLLRHPARRPGIRGLFPRDQSGGHSGRPSDARFVSCTTAQTGRTGLAGQPHARLLTFAVRADAGLQCFRPEGVRTVCEAAELLWPGSAGVKHWEGCL
ncbi:hypothetical protein TPA0905_40480 [Streptomyces olivaceus]|nr:hypothetical protein TPA0905_40480 [Streptomyces olivaceus]